MKKVIIGVLAVLDLLVGVQMIKECTGLKQANQAETAYQANADQISDLHQKTKNMDSTTVENVIKKQNINLSQIEKDNDTKVNQALDMTYNHVHNDQDFKNLKSKLPSLVGQSLSSSLINQSTPINGQSGTSYPNSKLNSATVSYGEYDLTTQTMPIEITVDFQTSSNVHGLEYYSGTFNVKTKQIQNVQYTTMTDEQGLQKQVANNG